MPSPGVAQNILRPYVSPKHSTNAPPVSTQTRDSKKPAGAHSTKDIKKHKLITNVTELLEMIGRAADLKYKHETAMTMV